METLTESIYGVEPPSGGKGSNWYRYVIAFEGNTTLTGCRQGSLTAVTSGVVDFVAQLNSQHSNKKAPRYCRKYGGN